MGVVKIHGRWTHEEYWAPVPKSKGRNRVGKKIAWVKRFRRKYVMLPTFEECKNS